MASGSPRRKELLKLIISEFDVIAADVEEICPADTDLKNRPEYLAVLKAKAVAKDYSGCVVIGADTAVILNGTMLGKPTSTENAREMLKSLSGKCHDVITGCAIIKGEKIKSFSVKTQVKFLPLTDKMIDNYIKTQEPLDKAGAYGIQGFGSLFVESISGDYFNVVGLPVSRLNLELADF